MTDLRALGLGCRPDLPDFRDYRQSHAHVQKLLQQLRRREPQGALTSRVDLRDYFPAVRDQGRMRCSSAHACVGLLEYFQRRVYGDSTPLSVRFAYRTTLRLMGQNEDCGADLRTTLKSLSRFGAPAENHWPYRDGCATDDPDAFLFQCAQRTAGFVYFRVADQLASGKSVLNVLKTYLFAEIPTVFMFGVPDSVWDSNCIDFRPSSASVLGGQAVVAVGYDDNYDGPTRGALLIRSSWGKAWGEEGYGWLPYAFIDNRLSMDFWAILRSDWVQSEVIYRPL